MEEKKTFSGKSAVLNACFTALGAALLAVCAWITIPVGEIPVTLQTFGVFVVAALLGAKRGALAVAVYLLLGAVGAPVFSGFRGGFASLAGVTGGYLIGFLPAAWLVGFASGRWSRKLPVLAAAMAAGLLVDYAFGSAWFMVVYLRGTGAITLWAVLGKCVIPFLIPDAVKLALAALLVRALPKGGVPDAF